MLYLRIFRVQSFLLVLILLLSSCARTTIKNAEEAMRPAREVPVLNEAGDLREFVVAIREQIEILYRDKKEMRFGDRLVSREEYALSLQKLLDWIHEGTSYTELWHKIQNHFDFYEVYGKDDWSQVFITSYYEPVIEARKNRDKKYSQPLYQLPDDLVEMRGMNFFWRGRLAPDENIGIEKVIPYYSRKEIDSDQKLANKKLELCYVDPLESFFMQIQGSGVVHFPDGEEWRIGYAGQNGHPYEAIGKYLKHIIPIEEMSADRIEAYLNTLSKLEQDFYLNKNPSYFFFRVANKNAVTANGASALGLRTIATDSAFFPKGALALLKFQSPLWNGNSVKWRDTVQLVLDQDVGGAIKGPGRVDLFWGRGKEAKKSASIIKQQGQLFYLVPKRSEGN